MNKVVSIAAIFVFLATVSSYASIFSQNTVRVDEQMFEGFVLTGDPNYDLSVFAKKNNLSKKDAKKILSNKFGTPKKPNEELFSKIAKSGNPKVDLENFAQSNNISKDEAKIILQNLFGDPEMP